MQGRSLCTFNTLLEERKQIIISSDRPVCQVTSPGGAAGYVYNIRPPACGFAVNSHHQFLQQ
ncbi:hypothetical protein J22TS3_05870 [Paenibacillus sp. J22TS3]|nr:hypothetical protein J22TS3_05870 [Paenibacillus sp. J22TS3]